MALRKLDIRSVRNIRSACIFPSPGINFIIGGNGCGKSSLLEAVFLLGRGRSFRTHQVKQAIHYHATELVVAAQQSAHSGVNRHLGIQIDCKQTQIHIDRETRSKSDLAYLLPIQLINPKSFNLLEAGPQHRRAFLDWGVFNDDERFFQYWRRYQRALVQRNALLKSRHANQIPAWDKELIENGMMIDELRKTYVTKLLPVFTQLVDFFIPFQSLDVNFFSGWNQALSLNEVCKSDLEKDLRYGFTHSGPHRADLIIRNHCGLARDFLSRGQLKLLIVALLLAQVHLLEEFARANCCILLDDISSELDLENRLKLLKYLTQMNCQVFITCNETKDLGDLPHIKNYKVFHVEQGCISEA